MLFQNFNVGYRQKGVLIMKKFIRNVTCTIGAVMLPALAMADPTLTVPDVDPTNLYDIAGAALAFIAIVVAVVAGFKVLKSAK